MVAAKVGRNDPCPCGSGVKYKRCCLAAPHRDSNEDRLYRQIHRAHTELGPRVARFAARTLGPLLFAEAQREFHLWREQERGLEPDSLSDLFGDWLVYRFVPDPLERREEFELELPERPVVELFLEREFKRISELERRLLRAALGRGNSFFAVRDCEPELGRLHLHDLLTEETWLVRDRDGARDAEPGMVLFAHVVPFEELPHFAACADIALPAHCQSQVTDARGELGSGQSGALDPDQLAALDLEVRDLYLQLVEEALEADEIDLCDPQEATDVADARSVRGGDV